MFTYSRNTLGAAIYDLTSIVWSVERGGVHGEQQVDKNCNLRSCSNDVDGQEFPLN